MLRVLADKAPAGAEAGYQPKDVRWALDFTAEGRFLGVIPLGEGKRGRRFDKCPNLALGEMKAGNKPKAHFLADSADRVVGYEAKDPEEATQRQEFFRGMLYEARRVLPELGSIAEALQDEAVLAEIRSQLAEHGAKPADKLTVRIGREFPLGSEAWHAWWNDFRAQLRPATTNRELGMVSFVSGQTVEPARVHEMKIKGLAGVGGQASGDVLVGFDKEAFASYGLEQSFNAAMSIEDAGRYCAGLNRLIEETGKRLGETLVVHWFTGKVSIEDDPLLWLEQAFSEEQVELAAQSRAQELLDTVRSGRRPDLAGNTYYAMTLSGQAGRVMLRDWMEGQFEDLVANVSGWFEDLAIVHRDGGRIAPDPKFYAVLGATVRDLDDLASPFVAKLWRVAIKRELIPQAALAQALNRTRVAVIRDEVASHARMGLMKAYHVRMNRLKGGVDMSQELQPYLNENHPSAAYQCGRLMAVLAGVQRAALGDVGAGVVQRYYAAASTTPALVLGRLVRTAQFHLNKLEGGLPHWYEQKIGEISGRLRDGIPRTLTLEEQSLFALGYYQQLADMRTKKIVSDQETTQEAENHE